MSPLTNYLKSIAELLPEREGWVYSGYEELVLDHGTLYTEGRVEVSGNLKECFMNAWYAADGNDWTYVEGYASSIIPVPHAWCIDQDGVLVETTWPELAPEYYGVPLDTRWAVETMAKSGYWGIFGNDWTNEVELLRHGIPVEALVNEVVS